MIVEDDADDRLRWVVLTESTQQRSELQATVAVLDVGDVVVGVRQDVDLLCPSLLSRLVEMLPAMGQLGQREPPES